MTTPVKKSVRIGYLDGHSREGQLLLWDESPSNSDQVKVELMVNDRVYTAESEEGYFAALCMIRKELEVQQMRILCLGSSRSVYPSGMSRSMGSGDKAYRLTMGQPARSADLVCIFDFDESRDSATIAEQEEFFAKWLESLS